MCLKVNESNIYKVALWLNELEKDAREQVSELLLFFPEFLFDEER